MNNSLLEQKEKNYIFFSINSSNYAFSSNRVAAVMQLVELEYPESMPDYMAGLLEYNNGLIKVIDLRKILSLESIQYGLNSKIIVIRDKDEVFGIIADDILEIRKIPLSSFNSTPYNNEDSLVKAIYTDKNVSSTIINLDNVIKKINSPDFNSVKSNTNNSVFLPDDVNSKEILHRRKLHYAMKMREISNIIIESQDTYITFLLEDNTCCIKILHVSGFYKYSNIKIIEVPCTPDFIKGVTNLKGRYITVIDLLKFTENKDTKITEDSRIVVVEYEDYQLGIITGFIGETIDIDENALKSASENSSSCLCEYVIKNQMYLFLDIKKLFSDEKLYIS